MNTDNEEEAVSGRPAYCGSIRPDEDARTVRKYGVSKTELNNRKAQ
jgi:hypothetical protein